VLVAGAQAYSSKGIRTRRVATQDARRAILFLPLDDVDDDGRPLPRRLGEDLVPASAPGRVKSSGLLARDGGRRLVERPAAGRELLRVVAPHALGQTFRRKGDEAALAVVLGFEPFTAVLREFAKDTCLTLAALTPLGGDDVDGVDGVEGERRDDGQDDDARDDGERMRTALRTKLSIGDGDDGRLAHMG